MKKETKASLIIFTAIFILGYVMTLLIPDSVLTFSIEKTTLLSTFANGIIHLITIRVVIAIAIATAVTLLVRIVDGEEKKEAKADKKTAKKEA